MGYQTIFDGSFSLSKPLTHAQSEYLTAFADTRRMNRNETLAELMPDAKREAVDLPVGKDAEYFVGGMGVAGQDRDDSIVDYNDPPPSQPGLWCKWAPTSDGEGIEWNGVEKFYDYVPWLRYLISNFLIPWGHTLNGAVEWKGEESTDIGRIVVNDNVVNVQRAVMTWVDD